MKKNFKATLMATTTLSLLVSAKAFAVPLVELTDFGNTLGTATVVTQLSPDVVFGAIGFGGDNDFLKWTGLLPGSGYTFTVFVDFAAGFESLNAAGVAIPVSGTVPSDGMLVARLFDDGAQGTESYTVSLAVTRPAAVDEPASLALFGVGAAAGLGLRRRKKQA